jgi:hypothetical protein
MSIRLYEGMGYTRTPLFGEYPSSPDASLCFGKSLQRTGLFILSCRHVYGYVRDRNSSKLRRAELSRVIASN